MILKLPKVHTVIMILLPKESFHSFFNFVRCVLLKVAINKSNKCLTALRKRSNKTSNNAKINDPVISIIYLQNV